MSVGDTLGWLGPDIGQISWEDQQPGPIKADLQPIAKGGKFKKVNSSPGKPRQETGKMESQKIRHRRMAANRAELAEQFEPERPGQLPFHSTDDIKCALA